MEQLNKLEERIKNRRQRRWKRRGRIVAPFLALPLLVGALMLSVDFIEYAPQEPHEPKKVENPIVMPAKRIQPSLAAAAAMSASATGGEDVLAPEALAPAKDKTPDLRLDDDTETSRTAALPLGPIVNP